MNEVFCYGLGQYITVLLGLYIPNITATFNFDYLFSIITSQIFLLLNRYIFHTVLSQTVKPTQPLIFDHGNQLIYFGIPLYSVLTIPFLYDFAVFFSFGE